MAEAFEEIRIECFYTSVNDWVNLTADVLIEPRPRGTRGIMNNGLLDRIPTGNTFTFSLNNSVSNSQASQGYYSSGIGAIVPGRQVRVGFKYDNRFVYKWYGFILPEGVKATEGVYGPRRVDVSCRDFFGLASEIEIDTLNYAINKRIDEAVDLLFESLPIPDAFSLEPLHKSYQQGDETFPTVFDLLKSNTTFLSELNKLVISELGYIYEQGNESDGRTFVVEKRTGRNGVANTTLFKRSEDTTDLFLLADASSKFLLADGSSKLLLTETQAATFTNADMWSGRELGVNTGEHFANKFTVSITSRSVDADNTSVLYTMESPLMVAAGETLTGIKARYRDPNQKASVVNCIEGLSPVTTTDWKAYQNSDGTGTDLTTSLLVSVEFYPAEANITLTNTGGTDLWTGGEDILFRLRGKGVYVYDTIEIEISRGVYDGLGTRSVNFPMVYFNDVNSIYDILTLAVLSDWYRNYRTINSYPLFANRDSKNMFAFLYLEPGRKGNFTATLNGYTENSFVNGYEFEIIDGQYVVWYPCLLRPEYILDT